jgi:hypothetical protein
MKFHHRKDPPRDPPVHLTHAEYLQRFGASFHPDGEQSDATVTPEDKRARLVAALEQARDARKFEIDMYWKRATYFWAFIAAAFLGYASFFNAKTPHGFAAFLMSMVGLVFTYAWHLVNRGSKFWQENWENHVELLEDAVTGPLFKTVAERPDPPGRPTWEDRRIGPQAISVSKVNAVVSLFLIWVWVELAVAAAGAVTFGDWRAWALQWPFLTPARARVAVLLAVAMPAMRAGWLLRSQVASHRAGHHPKITLRRSAPTPPSVQVPDKRRTKQP